MDLYEKIAKGDYQIDHGPGVTYAIILEKQAAFAKDMAEHYNVCEGSIRDDIFKLAMHMAFMGSQKEIADAYGELVQLVRKWGVF